ncbi:polysaccharide biosynthesis tyrosine autokinase [Altererythrobacter sp. HHU K3-1]|uniref:non-specific protein-tyrosine kinase n=1 Tax=Qipengyuania atrilutea TaxID=2744473 RepID=A0A850GXS1_9SPHN|nr:polysaccharide biosynthesis tyrosine autokinase [Actirhodobacter atriluteus]
MRNQHASSEGEDEAEARPNLLKYYVRVARRRKWLIAGITAAFVLLGLLISFLMTPQYTATATIEISRETDQVTTFQSVERDVSIGDQEFYQTQYGLLRSATLAERIATQLGLVDDPAFFEMFGALNEENPAFELNGDRFVAEGRGERIRKAGAILLENVAVQPARLSRLVDIAFSSPDPVMSERIANSWATNFIETNLERKVQATAYGREVLQRQLAEYKDRLDESQRQLVNYASQQGIINLPASSSGEGGGVQERSIVVDNLAALNAALSEATADRIRAETRFRQSSVGGSSPEALANDAINSLRQRRAELAAQYENMMVRFEPGYPAAQALQEQISELDRAITVEERRITSSLESGYRQARARENALQSRVNALKDEFLDLRRRSISYNVYQQEVETNQALYDSLLQRFKEIGVAGGVGVNNISVVDAAKVPQEPSSPRLLLNLLLAIVSGLVVGVLAALGLEQLDEAIGDPNELKQQLGLPLLGTVPKVTGTDSPRDALLDRKSDLFDAYLSIQTNLGFTTEHGIPKSFSVTSTRPAEGKSTTSFALATSLARSGRKVILVDGDMRSPSVHHLGEVDHDRGLSNYLAGEDDINSLTFSMPDLGLTGMSAGPIPPNAAQLLTSNRLSNLINRLLRDYDHVVIDSPPVMGLADAPLIASNVEGVIYAIESHGIRSSQVKAALARLRSANARIFGGVLTKFEPQKSSYGYEYGYGYGRDDEGVAA